MLLRAAAILLLLASPPQTAMAIDNGLGRLPPLAWRSWNAFDEYINQSIAANMIDELVAERLDVDGKPTSLRELGYDMVGIDQGWEGCGMGVNGTQHYANGTPAVNSKFPDLGALVAYGHSHNVKMGFYLNGCACGERHEHLINYQGDVELTHRLGFDGVKIDGCGAQLNMTLYAELFNKTGKPIMTENCHQGQNFTDGGDPGQMGPGWCPYNFFRSSGDIKSVWDRVIENLLSVTKFLTASKSVSLGAAPHAGFRPPPPPPPPPPRHGTVGATSRPGCFAYPDMLEVGRMEGTGQSSVAMSEAESSSHFAGWSIVSAPLVLGFDLSNATRMKLVWPYISNRRAMAVSQTWQAGRPDPSGSLIKTWQAPNLEAVVVGCGCASPCVNRNENCSMWAKANQCAENPSYMRTMCPKSCPTTTDSKQSGWRLQSSGLVTTPSGACLDAAGQLPALDAGPNWLRTRKCDPSSDTQKFTHGGSQLKAHDGRCLGVVMHWLWTQPMVSLLTCGGGKTFVALDVANGTLESGSGYGCLGVSQLTGPPSSLWRKPLPNGQTAVLAINGAALPQVITLNVSEVLALDARPPVEGAAAHATDVWSGKELGAVSAVTRTVPAHGNIFLTLSPPK